MDWIFSRWSLLSEGHLSAGYYIRPKRGGDKAGSTIRPKRPDYQGRPLRWMSEQSRSQTPTPCCTHSVPFSGAHGFEATGQQETTVVGSIANSSALVEKPAVLVSHTWPVILVLVFNALANFHQETFALALASPSRSSLAGGLAHACGPT